MTNNIALIGGETTRVSREPAPYQAPKEASLVEIYGPNLGRRYILDLDVITVGRDEGNTLVLDDDSVSRTHARFVAKGPTVTLEDLGSTNGSFVNDEEVERVQLRNGDQVKIGSVMFKFISGGNAEALYHEEIYRMTITDGLTGAPNRRYLLDFLERELARAVRYERPLSLAMFDIDHFKQINDTYGHLAGDFVLRKMATDLRRLVRREELFARYGGEEFALVMPETPAERAVQFAERVRQQVEQTSFEFDDKQIHVTVSIGIAPRPADGVDVHGFIQAADGELYRAKEDGRNRVCVAPEATP